MKRAQTPYRMFFRLGQVLAVVGVLPIATIGFVSGRVLCIHVHGDRGNHMHLVERTGLDTWAGGRGDCHGHQETPGRLPETRGDHPSDPVTAEECRGTLIFLNDSVMTPPVSQTFTRLAVRSAGPVAAATIDGEAGMAALQACRPWQWRQGAPRPSPTVEAILRSNHALLL